MQNDTQKAADKLAEMCQLKTPVDERPPHLALATSIPNTPALLRTLSTTSSSSSSSDEGSTPSTPLFDEHDADVINFSSPRPFNVPRPISRTASGDSERVDAAFDGYVGGFHVPPAMQKARSTLEGWAPHMPIGQPMS